MMALGERGGPASGRANGPPARTGGAEGRRTDTAQDAKTCRITSRVDANGNRRKLVCQNENAKKLEPIPNR